MTAYRRTGAFYASFQSDVGLGAGAYTDLSIPFNCSLIGWTLLADQTGSVTIDVWKSTYGAYPPVIGGNIAASTRPTISSAVKNTDSNLTGWTKSLSLGDILRLTVDADSVITNLLVALRYAR